MHLKDISLLFVEDNDDTRNSIGSFMKDNVKIVYLAKNGLEGLDIFYEHKPDIVITDIKMPVLDGIEMSNIIKQNYPKTPIIALSAYNDSYTLQMRKDAMIDDFLEKPIDSASTIIHKLQNFVSSLTNHNKKTESKLSASEDNLQTKVLSKEKMQDTLFGKNGLDNKNDSNFCIALVQIDNLKSIDKKCGKKTKYILLKDIGNTLLTNSKTSYIVGEWKEDRFIIILPKIDKKQATLFMKNIRDQILLHSYNDIDSLDVSFVVSEYKDNRNLKEIIKKMQDIYDKKIVEENTICIL